jgi:uncharacterized membrane protein
VQPAPPPAAPAPEPLDAFWPPVQPAAAPVHRTSEEWEALIGGNWVNKIGVFVAVIGIALLLNYAWTQLGAAGRVALSLVASLAMLSSGVYCELQEKYRTFGYGPRSTPPSTRCTPSRRPRCSIAHWLRPFCCWQSPPA